MSRAAEPTSSPVSAPPSRCVIATRESRLALWQAEHVRALLQQRWGATVDLLGMTTRGDQILDRTLSKVGGKGLFVKELETTLEEGRADLAVHSLKDVPMELPQGFCLAAILEREDPRDAFVSNHHADLSSLPDGAVVGTSSLRRMVQIRRLRPDLRIEALRGNLDTRLRKLDDGGYDAIVLATAGLKRLGLSDRIRCSLPPEQMLPAAGQGALGLEMRQDRPDQQVWAEALAQLNHGPTWLACHAERAVSRAMGGSCSMPLAAHAEWLPTPAGTQPSTLRLRALLGHPVQPRWIEAESTQAVGQTTQAQALGDAVAASLRAQADPEWLAALAL